MARAVRVRGIRPKDTLRENAQKVIATRLAELLSWRAALLDPSAIQDLHNMRIAAKRLRYALEMFEICFPEAERALDQLTEIQESIGDIHDLDVLIDLMRDRLRELDRATEHAAVKIMESDASASEKSNKLRQALYSQARDRKRLGLIGLIADNVVERSRQFASFQATVGRHCSRHICFRSSGLRGTDARKPGTTTLRRNLRVTRRWKFLGRTNAKSPRRDRRHVTIRVPSARNLVRRFCGARPLSIGDRRGPVARAAVWPMPAGA